jgi:hypothetical protein
MKYLIQVKPQYRKFITNTNKQGFVQRTSGRALNVKSRTLAEKVRQRIVTSAFPKAKSKQSIAYSMFKIIKKK